MIKSKRGTSSKLRSSKTPTGVGVLHLADPELAFVLIIFDRISIYTRHILTKHAFSVSKNRYYSGR